MSQVLKVWIAQRPPGFGFVLMSCPGDAEDAVRSLHGTRMCGNRWERVDNMKRHRQADHGMFYRVTVEMANRNKRSKQPNNRRDRYRTPDRDAWRSRKNSGGSSTRSVSRSSSESLRKRSWKPLSKGREKSLCQDKLERKRKPVKSVVRVGREVVKLIKGR